MAAAMATATTSLGGNHIGRRMTAQSGVQGFFITAGSDSFVGHQYSGHNQVLVRGHVSTATVQCPMCMASDSIMSSLAIAQSPRVPGVH